MNNIQFHFINSKIVSLLLILVLFLSFICINLFQYTGGPNRVVLQTNIDRSLPDTLSLSNYGSNFDVESQNINNTPLFLYNFRIKIFSRGIFNWINNIEIRPLYINQTNENSIIPDNYYRWSIVYHHAGEKIINAAILFIDPLIYNGSAVQARIDVKASSSGLFAQSDIVNQYSILLTA
jgi:hypothetical protein